FGNKLMRKCYTCTCQGCNVNIGIHPVLWYPESCCLFFLFNKTVVTAYFNLISNSVVKAQFKSLNQVFVYIDKITCEIRIRYISKNIFLLSQESSSVKNHATVFVSNTQINFVRAVPLRFQIKICSGIRQCTVGLV